MAYRRTFFLDQVAVAPSLQFLSLSDVTGEGGIKYRLGRNIRSFQPISRVFWTRYNLQDRPIAAISKVK